MNSDINTPQINEDVPSGKAPSAVVTVILSLAAVAAAALMPELGFAAMLILAAVTVFTASAMAPLPVLLIPIIGIGAAYLRGGVFFLAVAAVLWVASLISGCILRRGGDFHRALTAFILVIFGAAAAGAAVYTRMKGISAADISDMVKNSVHDAMANAAASMGDSLPLDTAKLMTEQYEAVAENAVMYIPAAVGCFSAIGGIIAIRLAGLLHDLTGSEVYPDERRIASVDRIYAVLYFVSLILGAFDAGAVGICASNVMIILMIPAAAAGVSAYRISIRRRREEGVRGLPFSLLLLILSFVIFSPAVGMMLLSFTGAFAAFAKNKDTKGNG